MSRKIDRPWTQEEIDKVLNIILDEKDLKEHNFEMLCRRIGTRFSRSWDSIRTLLWKLATRYREHKEYHPSTLRMNRANRPFMWIDEYICHLAWNKKDKLVQIHVAGILMRPYNQIYGWFERQESKGRKKLGVFDEKTS